MEQGHCIVTREREWAVVQKSWLGTLCVSFGGGCISYFLVWEEEIVMYCGLVMLCYQQEQMHLTKLVKKGTAIPLQARCGPEGG